MFNDNEIRTALNDLKVPSVDDSIEYAKLKNKIKWRFKKGTRVCVCRNIIH